MAKQENTLDSIRDFDASCVEFSEPKQDKFGSRITIKYRYRKAGGKFTEPLPLRIVTPDIRCTGIWTKGKEGVSDPYACLNMHDLKSEPSESQSDCIQLIQAIDKTIIDHFSRNEIRKKIGYKGDVNDYNRMVQGLKSLRYKVDNDTGSVIPGEPPTLFAKLATKFDANRTKENRDSIPPVITTTFTELDRYIGNFNVIDSNDVVSQFYEQPFMMTGVLVLNSVYVNLKTWSQYKMVSCAVLQRLPKKSNAIVITKISDSMKRKYESSCADDEDDSFAQ